MWDRRWGTVVRQIQGRSDVGVLRIRRGWRRHGSHGSIAGWGSAVTGLPGHERHHEGVGIHTLNLWEQRQARTHHGIDGGVC